jgi:hypothetical protein
MDRACSTDDGCWWLSTCMSSLIGNGSVEIPLPSIENGKSNRIVGLLFPTWSACKRKLTDISSRTS